MSETMATRCCIAGGGPAGMMLGFLLARAGIDVVVLEKHKDFLRDFRGDTIHPSTLELMHELGLLAAFLKLPHARADRLSGRYGSLPVTIADFAGQSASLGWVSYLTFLALISISLGVLNLLPIPLLDGGHLMYYLIEIVTGRPVSERAMELGQRVGLALLLVMMAFAFYNDLNRLLTG